MVHRAGQKPIISESVKEERGYAKKRWRREEEKIDHRRGSTTSGRSPIKQKNHWVTEPTSL